MNYYSMEKMWRSLTSMSEDSILMDDERCSATVLISEARVVMNRRAIF